MPIHTILVHTMGEERYEQGMQEKEEDFYDTGLN